jgi:hypothetical protein
MPIPRIIFILFGKDIMIQNRPRKYFGEVILRIRSVVFTLMALTPGVVTAQPHPHLFFDQADVAMIQARAQSARADNGNFFADPYNEILIDCRSPYGPGKPVPIMSGSNLSSRNAQAIISHATLLLADPNGLAVADRYQSNTRFLDYYFAILDDPGWSSYFNNDPFNTTLFLIALCTGFDWHFDIFTDTQRNDIITKLAARADYLLANETVFFEMPADLDDPDLGFQSTFKVLRNRDRIAMSGLGFVAYTLAGEVDEGRRQGWIAKVDELLGLFKTHNTTDGYWFEGFTYHTFLNKSLYPMLTVRSRKTGINEFMFHPQFSQAPIYSIYSWVPGGDRSFIESNPIGDADTDGPPADVRSLDALSAAQLKGHADGLDHLANWMQFRSLGGLSNNSYSRVDPMQFIWSDDSIAMASPQDLGLPTFHHYPERGAFTWRSSWDSMATYFAMLCGPVIGGHQQPEQGNFIFYHGGTPFITHHHKTLNRRTEHHNVLMVNDAGQFGDRHIDGEPLTEPQPESNWPKIMNLVADTGFFNIFCDLKPIYREPQFREYQREFLYTCGTLFIRDRIRDNDDATYDLLLHSYATDPPVSPASNPDGFEVLNIDSRMLDNPWSGSGASYDLTPRSTGPFTGSLNIRDLSQFNWSSSVMPSMVSDPSGDFQRGFFLSRSITTRSVSSLVSLHFPMAGRVLEQWPETGTVDDGFRITVNGETRALTVWLNEAGAINTLGVMMNGRMGGVDLDELTFWGREITSLNYNGIQYMTADQPVTLYARTQTEDNTRVRYHAESASNLTLLHPQPVGSVKVDGVELSNSSWSWNNGELSLVLEAQPSGPVEQILIAISTVTGPDTIQIIDFILGISSEPTGLDVNSDGVIDIGDAVANVEAGR